MSVYALKPKFSNYQGYKEWINSWKTVHAHISEDIRRRKHELRNMQRVGDPLAGKMQKNLLLQRADARKLMTILEEAKSRWDRIKAMKQQIRDQVAGFPITFDARVADFHFNKVAIEHSWMPKWVLKAAGKSYYIEHVDAQMGFSTRELESGSTLGMLRFRKCRITIDENNVATLVAQPAMKIAA